MTLRAGSDGALIMPLEAADISALLEVGWKPPRPIVVKAADGATDLYGMMFTPTNVDDPPRARFGRTRKCFWGPRNILYTESLCKIFLGQDSRENILNNPWGPNHERRWTNPRLRSTRPSSRLGTPETISGPEDLFGQI